MKTHLSDRLVRGLVFGMQGLAGFHRLWVVLGVALLMVLPAQADKIMWTNVNGGSWSTALNWDPNQEPGPSDEATIGGYHVVVHGSASVMKLTFSGGTLQVDGGLAVRDLFFERGTISGEGTLTVNHQMDWTGGSMTGTGRTVIAPSAILNLNNLGDITIYYRTLENVGTVAWHGDGDLNAGQGAVLTNCPGGKWEVYNDRAFQWPSFGNTPRFDNAGTFLKTFSPGVTTFICFPFTNYSTGTVEVQNGAVFYQSTPLAPASTFEQSGAVMVRSGAVLKLGGGGTANTPFWVDNDGWVDWTGSYTLVAGAELNGPGMYRVSGGTLAVNGDVPVRNMDLLATLGGSGTLAVSNRLNWISGSMTGSGRTLIAPGATLNLTNREEVLIETRTLENANRVEWTGVANLIAGRGAVLTNCEDAVWEVRNDQTLSWNSYGITPRFDNAGTFSKTQASNTTSFICFSFTNHPSGTVAVHSGTVYYKSVPLAPPSTFAQHGAVNVSTGAVLRLEGGGTANSPFWVDSGGVVDWTGSYTLVAKAQLNGDGFYRVSGGTLEVNGSVPVRNMDLLATLGGTNTLTVSNKMNWISGWMRDSGRTLIAAGATLNLTNAAEVLLETRTMENAGRVEWTGTGNLTAGRGAVLTNCDNAVWEVRNDQKFGWNTYGDTPQFDNAGTFSKSQSTGTTAFACFPFTNHMTGTLAVQSGTVFYQSTPLAPPSTFHQSGAVNVSTGAVLRLAGGGTANSPFWVDSGGLVDWAGSYTLVAKAQLNGDGLYRVSGGTLEVNGAVPVQNMDLLATLGGTNTLTVSNVMNWTSGSMAGTGRTVIAHGATLNVSNAVDVTLSYRTLENAGTVVWNGSGNLVGQQGAVLTNCVGALWEARNDRTLNWPSFGNTPRFDNEGTFRKIQSTGTTAFVCFPFTNHSSGTVAVHSGTVFYQSTPLAPPSTFNQYGAVNVSTGAVLRLAGGGTGNSPFRTETGGVVDWTGSYTLEAGAELNGPGVYRVSGGTLEVNGAVPVRNMDLLATLGGTNTLTVSNKLNWISGWMSGSGRTVIAPAATLNLTNAADVTLYGRTLENAGTVVWVGSGNVYGAQGAVMTNCENAVWEVRNDSALRWSSSGNMPRFDNAGRFLKSQGAGTNIFHYCPFTNYGTLSIWQGTLSFSHAPNLTSAGTAEFALSGSNYPTNYGRIMTSQPLQLAGRLAVTFRNGYLPGPGLHYEIISAPISGVFPSYTAPPISPQITIAPFYQPNVVQLVTTDPTPTLSKPAMDAEKRFTMEIGGVVGQCYAVEASTDLLAWTSLVTNTMPANAVWLFVDSDKATMPRRFYRARFEQECGVPAVPALAIARSNNAVIVSWPLTADDWVLEHTNALSGSSAPWPQIPPPYQTNGGTLQFTEPAPTGTRFYRLQK